MADKESSANQAGFRESQAYGLESKMAHLGHLSMLSEQNVDLRLSADKLSR